MTRPMRNILAAILITVIAATGVAKNTSTTRRNLRPGVEMQREMQRIATPDDTICAEAPCDFDPDALTLRGFVKRAGDERESFIVDNHSTYHITGVKLLLRYYAADGTVITERSVEVKCDIMPGKWQRVKVLSFDRNHAYHYIYGSRPRLKSKPFDVAYRLLRYDVAVSR